MPSLKALTVLLSVTVLISCKKDEVISIPSPPAPPVLLKDVVEDHLPSPYYHFEYDSSKKVSFVSFASDFTRYHVVHENGRISEMQNDILVNKDRLKYVYDNVGRVVTVNYADSMGNIYTQVDLTYDGKQLVKLAREKKVGDDFVLDKEINMSYHPDGNLRDIIYHYLPFNGAAESSYSIHYENYDDKLNVDGFGLIHNDFFDHFVFLPGVQIQKNNPRIETLSAENNSYTVTYTYTYNENKAPLAKRGDLLFLDGPQKGQRIVISSRFSYYE